MIGTTIVVPMSYRISTEACLFSWAAGPPVNFIRFCTLLSGRVVAVCVRKYDCMDALATAA